MLRRALLVSLVLAATGCVDTLGIGSDCDAAMRDVRRQEGRPPDDVRESELAGNFTSRWFFFDSGTSGRVYTFRWGTSHSSCQVESARMSLLPTSPDEP
jgi:hypothetical protein